METPLLVFVPELTPRISYTFALFFESLLPTAYRITTDIVEYKAHTGPRLNYSGNPLENEKLFFRASGLLSEKTIVPQNILVSEWQGMKIFYQVNNSALPFDVFSATFYLVSRYEEYLGEDGDAHNRFRAKDSLAFKNHFLDIPIVNVWAQEFKKVLLKYYPDLKFGENEYSFIPTIDIDVAYAHLGRNAMVTMGSYLKALFKFDFKAIVVKTYVLLGIRKDEYDTYQYQEDIFKRFKMRPIYFILAGNRSEYDKNIATGSRRFATLIVKLRSYGEIGIHPSYSSNSDKEIVQSEIKRVEKKLTGKLTKSRQHFLKITLPGTYRCLAESGITDDYSMAYAAAPGFRAGICTPFFFYDLQSEKVLPVKVHSTVIMDGTFNEYLNISPAETIPVVQKLILQVKNNKGEFISIWHNHSLGDMGQWKGWRAVFETMMKEGAQ